LQLTTIFSSTQSTHINKKKKSAFKEEMKKWYFTDCMETEASFESDVLNPQVLYEICKCCFTTTLLSKANLPH